MLVTHIDVFLKKTGTTREEFCSLLSIEASMFEDIMGGWIVPEGEFLSSILKVLGISEEDLLQERRHLPDYCLDTIKLYLRDLIHFSESSRETEKLRHAVNICSSRTRLVYSEEILPLIKQARNYSRMDDYGLKMYSNITDYITSFEKGERK